MQVDLRIFISMATHTDAVAKKLVENLQSDLRALSSETKRKYPPVKEVRC